MPKIDRGVHGRLRTQTVGDEARTNMLARGVRHVETQGATMGIASSVLTRLIADEGLTPAQFGGIWATPEAFFTDLFCDLADQARADRADTETLLSTWQYLSTRTDDLRTPEGRRSILLDVIRTAAEYNFQTVTTSSKWRTYAALSTTVTGWADDVARERILSALRASEVAFVETMETFYRNVLPTIGHRLKPAFKNDYQPFVIAAASVIEGLGIVRSTVPSLVTAEFELSGDEGAGSGRWSAAALAFVGVVDAFIEPDPTFTPNDAIARLSTGMDVSPQQEGASGVPY